MVSILTKRFASIAVPTGTRAGYGQPVKGRRNMMASHFRTCVRALVATFVLVACSGGHDDPAEGGNQASVPLTPKGWNLVWSDEFGGALDTSKWNIQTGDGTAEGIPGWGNNELQSYQADNISVADGNLMITTRQEEADGRAHTSGRINTAGKLDMRYGRIEASIHAADGQGLWSAFWMLPTDSAYGTWAAGGEIDIMEVFSRDPSPFTQAAAHYGMAWPLNTFNYAKHMEVDPADGFHLYALEWDAQEIRWFVDGTHYHTVRNSTYWNYYRDAATNAHVAGSDSAPFDRPFHLLLNLAVGGNLPGAPTPDALPEELLVDYVRVYECTIDTETGTGCDGFTDYTDPSVTPPAPDNVFRAVYDLYVDAVGPLTFPNAEDSVALDFGVYDAGGRARALGSRCRRPRHGDRRPNHRRRQLFHLSGEPRQTNVVRHGQRVRPGQLRGRSAVRPLHIRRRDRRGEQPAGQARQRLPGSRLRRSAGRDADQGRVNDHHRADQRHRA